MGWTVFEIIVNMLQGFIIQKFMENRMHVSKEHKIQDILCISLVTIYLSLPLFIKTNIPDIMVFAVPLVYTLLIADDKWYVSVFWTITLTVMFLTIVSLVLHIFTSIPGCSYDEIMKNTGIRIMFVLTTNGILTLALYFTSKIKKDYSAPYWSSLLLFLATNAALLLVEESLYALQINGEYETVSSNVHFCMAYAGICASTLLVALLYYKMSQSLENENRYKAEASAIRQSQKNQQEMEEMYKHLLAARHDLKQHMEIIEELGSMSIK